MDENNGNEATRIFQIYIIIIIKIIFFGISINKNLYVRKDVICCKYRVSRPFIQGRTTPKPTEVSKP